MALPDGLKDVQVLIFDFDGTLASGHYDFARMRADVARLVETHGLDPEKVEAVGTLELASAAAELLPPHQAHAFRQQADAAICAVEIEGARGAALLPGVREALQSLRAAGCAIAVITRNCRAVINVILDGAALPCDVLLAREDVSHVKPHPAHTTKALQALGAAPAQAAMVGDHPIDMEAAMRAGLVGIGVLTGHSTEQALREAGAAFIYADVPALADDFLNREG